MADAYDTGICDAVHNVEPKVGRHSRGAWSAQGYVQQGGGICEVCLSDALVVDVAGEQLVVGRNDAAHVGDP